MHGDVTVFSGRLLSSPPACAWRAGASDAATNAMMRGFDMISSRSRFARAGSKTPSGAAPEGLPEMRFDQNLIVPPLPPLPAWPELLLPQSPPLTWAVVPLEASPAFLMVPPFPPRPPLP